MAASRKKTPADAVLDTIAAAWPDPLGSGLSISGKVALEVGLSGGLDSVCLLWTLSRLAPARGVSLAAMHVHHGLSRHADQWADFCVELCEQWRIPLRVVRVQVARDSRVGIEAEARAARYRAFVQGGARVTALAHHADDQAETVLLQALRGAGAHGLAAMPAWRETDAGHGLWRPLLAVPRQTLAEAAAQLGLRWIEDDSNADVRYRRNFLRHRLVPELAAGLPDYREQLARTAARAADAAAILDEVARQDMAQLAVAGALDCDGLAALSVARRRNVVAHFVLARTGVNLTPTMLDTVLAQALESREAAVPLLRQGDTVLFRAAGRLEALHWSPLPSRDVVVALREGGVRPADWPGTLSIRRRIGQGVSLVGSTIELRARRGGESIVTKGGRKEVRKLFQEAGIAPYLRERWPLLYVDGELVAVPGMRAAADRRAGPEEAGWWLEWQPDG